MPETLLHHVFVLLFLSFAGGMSSPPSIEIQAQAARRIDVSGDILPTDMAARLDFFANALREEPSARGFIIVYRSRRDLPGLSSRRANWMRNYLIHRGFAPDRIVAIDGGAAWDFAHEMWIVPRGTAPTPRSDAYNQQIEDTSSTRKFDEYFFSTPDDQGDGYGSEYENGAEGFADALRKEPKALAFIIAYSLYRIDFWDDEDKAGRKTTKRQVSLDRAGIASNELRSMKTDLVKKYGISASRIRLINGGYRKARRIELWIVPPGEHPPIPTPNAFPPRRSGKRQ